MIDLDIIAIVGILNALRNRLPINRGISELSIAWTKAIGASGPGTIVLHLDETLDHEGGGQYILEALAAIRDEALGFGDRIPSNVLADVGNITGVAFQDYPTKLVLTAIEDLERCLSSEPPLT